MGRLQYQALALMVVTLVVDQISKELVLGYLVVVWNRGVSFGMLGGDRALPPWVLSAVAVAVCIALFIWLRRSDRPLHGWGIGLVIGGAIGNVIDRVRWGAVFDFADFYVGQWHWPAFNVADSAIVVGVGLMLIDSLVGEKQRAP